MPSINGSTHASANSPAHQVRAQNPGAKGAEFGALVSATAKAKHAAPPPEPVVEPTPPEGTPPATDGEPGGVVDVVA